MIKWIATALALTFATSAYAMTPIPVNQPAGMVTQVRLACGPGRTRVGGVCVARSTIRHTRRSAPVPPMAWRRLRSVVRVARLVTTTKPTPNGALSSYVRLVAKIRITIRIRAPSRHAVDQARIAPLDNDFARPKGWRNWVALGL
jgi:hypothetical protein